MAVIDTPDDILFTAPAPAPSQFASTQVIGQPGTQTYYYWVVAHYPIGAVVSGPFLVRNAPDNLGITNYVVVSWQPVPTGGLPPSFILFYDLLRTTVPTFPQMPGNYAVEVGTSATTWKDQNNVVGPYTPGGLQYGAPAHARIYLNNRDYPQPTLEIPVSLKVTTIIFPDGSSQSSSAGQTPWTSNIDAAQFKLTNIPEIDFTDGVGQSGMIRTVTGGFQISAAGSGTGLYLYSPALVELLSSQILYESNVTSGPAHQFVTSVSAVSFVIESNGLVGVNTGTPTESLSVNGALLISGSLLQEETACVLIDYGSGVDAGARIFSCGPDSATFGAIQFIQTTAAGSVEQARRVMIMGPNGYVGIGVPGDPVLYPLEVRNVNQTGTQFHISNSEFSDDGGYLTSTTPDNIWITAGASYDGTNVIAKAAHAEAIYLVNGEILFNVYPSTTPGAIIPSGNSQMVLTSSGLGIGSQNPQATLHVTTGTQPFEPSPGQTFAAIIANMNNTPGSGGLLVENAWHGSNSFIFQVASDFNGSTYAFTPYLTVLGDGSVGIGTAATNGPFHIHIAADVNFVVTAGGGQTLFGNLNDANTAWNPISTYGNFGLAVINPAYQLELSQDSAAKPGTNTWTIASDIRTKKNVQRFDGDIEVIRKLEPIVAEYNGLSHTPEGMRVVSFDPDALKQIVPQCVTYTRGKLAPGDMEETEIAGVNTHELFFHLLRAVQNIDARLQTLEAPQ